MARVRACECLLSRGWGQPSPEIDLDVADGLTDGEITFVFRMGEEPDEIEAEAAEEAAWTTEDL